MKYFFLLPFLLFSCSTLKDEECQNRDWYKQGLSDGERGYSSEMFKTYKMVCEEREDQKSLDRYNEGYRLGTQKYCTFNKGILVGESGRPYPSACPSKRYPKFKNGYQEGKKKALKQRAPY